MKLITLNMWGGRVGKPLSDFLEKHSDVDIFLFQEIYSSNNEMELPFEEGRARISDSLKNHKGYFRPATENGFGLGIFVKEGIMVEEEGEIFVHNHKNAILGERWWNDIGKNLQYVKISIEGTVYTIFNLHGLWDISGKTDTPDRIKQSEKVIEFIKRFDGNKILCGDFNLRPETESILMIERELGFKNLIKEYGVTSTRTSLYTRSDEKFTDYIFTSSDMNVKKFEVMTEEVSDHAVLYLEI